MLSMTVTKFEHCSTSSVGTVCSAISVLVIDDDDDFRALARTVLEAGGFKVNTVATATEATERVLCEAPDVILLDIVMPDKDGFETLPYIRGLYPDTKIVTVSGASDSELYLKISSYLGADASLNKSRIASICGLLNVILGE